MNGMPLWVLPLLILAGPIGAYLGSLHFATVLADLHRWWVTR